MWQALREAIFVGNAGWKWRRRVTFTGCIMALWMMVDACKFQTDPAWKPVELLQAIGLWTFTLGIYFTGAQKGDELDTHERIEKAKAEKEKA